VWVLPGPGDEILCSLKLYRLQFTTAGESCSGSILGSLFTPVELRERGYATALAEFVLERTAAEGDAFTLLFSDIGGDFYRSLGFRTLPAWELYGRLDADRQDRVGVGSPGWEVRPLESSATGLVERLYLRSTAHRALAIARDAGQWEYLRERTRAFFRNLPEPISRARILLASRQGRPIGYAMITEAAGEWVIRELVAADPDQRVEMWQALLDFGSRAGIQRVYGWLDAELAASFPGGACRRRRRRIALPMVCPHRTKPDWGQLSEVGQDLLAYQDQF
jgi:predicted acetyltransferase